MKAGSMGKFLANITALISLSSFLFTTFAFSETIHIYENSFSYDPIHQAKSNTKESMTPAIDFINNAKTSIDIEIYEIREPLIQEAILKALKRGVAIRIVGEPDPVGNGCDVFSRYNPTTNKDCYESYLFTDTFYSTIETNKRKYPSLKNSGIGYFNKNLCYDPIKDKPNYCYQHGKIMIRDGKDLLLSTGNFNDTGLCLNDKRTSHSCNRDFTVIAEDSHKVTALSQIFNLDYSYSAPCDLPPKTPRPGNLLREYTEGECLSHEEIDIDPLDYQTEIIKILNKNKENKNLTVGPVLPNNVVDLIERAKKIIQVEAQYLKEPDWHEALMRAANRGVKIEITLASFCHFNQKNGIGSISYNDYNGETGYFKRFINPLVKHKSKNVSLKILTHEIPYVDGKGYSGYLHSKVFIIDEKEFWIGSTNGSQLSTNSNREYGLFINDSTTSKKLSLILKNDHQNSVTLTKHVPPYTSGEIQGKIEKGGCRIAPKTAKDDTEEYDDF